ncbi:MAG: hypothetical protein R2827_16665 [Bdellovibrionales bacterium]
MSISSVAGRDAVKAAYDETVHFGVLRFIEKAVNWSLLKNEIEAVEQSYKSQKSYVDLTRTKVRRGTAKAYELDQNLADLYSYETRLTQLKVKQKQYLRDLSETLQWNSDQLQSIDLPKINPTIPTTEEALLEMALE